MEYSDSEEESDEEGSEGEEEFEGFDDASEDEDEDEDELDTKATARPYMTLIKSLTEETDAPQAKRRKLHHQGSPKQDDSRDEPDDTEMKVAEDIDLVEEPEEAADEQDAQGAFDEDDDDDEKVDASDPFETHFGAHDGDSIARRLKTIEDSKWVNKKISTKGTRTVLSGPDTGDESDQISVPTPISDPSNLSLKHRLRESLKGQNTKFDAVEQSLAPYVFGYRDMLYCNRSYQNGKSVRRLACLHALNHVFKYVFHSCAKITEVSC